ncbi:hypothetical protein EXIGLDRAFT_620909 [Exidia glandulosa HHB12029]|uniref:CsbD-like domain-containing protein n=1 Tax=Exidia glandulosa HHB12029 TaxID=1314781 RepID=A0A165ELF8_EXIGL|nr:hypothetical protein EXIGLDRAFT_620909 [Exidia glandulosa HHB12029]
MLHSESQPLPRPEETGAGIDFNAIPAQEAPPTHRIHSESEPLPPPGENAFNESERPLNVQPVREGGVALEGREGLPEGKATFVDKAVGKTQKVVGKMTKNWDMHERGELREAGGKAAAAGEARAPHD